MTPWARWRRRRRARGAAGRSGAEQGGGRAVEVGKAGEERVKGALVGDALVEQAGRGADVGEVAEGGEGGRVAEVQGRGGVGRRVDRRG